MKRTLQVILEWLLGDLTPQQGALFYLGIPVLISTLNTISVSGSVQFTSRPITFAYQISIIIVLWWMLEGFTRLFAFSLRPIRAPLIIPMALATIAAVTLNGPLAIIRASVFDSYLVSGSVLDPFFPWRFTDPDYLRESLLGSVSAFLVWLIANMTLVILLKVPRFGYLPLGSWRSIFFGLKDQIEPSREPTGMLFSLIPESLERTVISLEADEHYVRVTTAKGEHLVHYAFRKALNDVSNYDGIRVHRSHWVATTAIKSVHQNGRNLELRLINGKTVPVSRTYKVKVEELGLPIHEAPTDLHQ